MDKTAKLTRREVNLMVFASWIVAKSIGNIITFDSRVILVGLTASFPSTGKEPARRLAGDQRIATNCLIHAVEIHRRAEWADQHNSVHGNTST
jgi:hypothetical protein